MITNYFTTVEFLVTIKRLPEVEFFVQRTQIPGISANAPTSPSPFNRLVQTPDKLQYDPLELSFIVDEKMNNYLSVFSWIKGLTFPERYSQFKNLADSEHKIYSDISIVCLNSHKNPVLKIDFTDCIPVSLSLVNLDTTQTDVVYPEATVTFNYNYFNIEAY